MADAVSICNLALSFIGDSASVMSIDPPDASTQARMCAVFYPHALGDLIAMYDWSFATRQATLAKLSKEESRGWTGVYAVPADCIRVIDVKEERTQNLGLRENQCFTLAAGEKGTRVLFTNMKRPVMTYISSDALASQYPPSFSTALAWYLANMLVGSRVKGKEGFAMSQNCMKQFQVAYRLATSLDASQQRKTIDRVPGWIKGR